MLLLWSLFGLAVGGEPEFTASAPSKDNIMHLEMPGARYGILGINSSL